MKEKTIHLADGTRHKVLTETDRYFICKNTQFRKSSKRIIKITEKEVSEQKEE